MPEAVMFFVVANEQRSVGLDDWSNELAIEPRSFKIEPKSLAIIGTFLATARYSQLPNLSLTETSIYVFSIPHYQLFPLLFVWILRQFSIWSILMYYGVVFLLVIATSLNITLFTYNICY